MADKKDIVEVGIEGALDQATQSGRLSFKAKSRFIGALDRFFGNAFDLPATWMKTKSGRMKHEEKIRQKAREFQLETYKRVVSEKGDDEVARLISSAQWKNIDAQLNLEAIAHEAAELLAESEPAGDGSANGPATGSENETINPDWLNRFRTHAENATSSELRNLWARILAGEANSPGQFSASALRFIAEVDKQQAQRCERVSKHVVLGAVFKTEEHSSNEPLTDGLALQAQGLLTGVGGTLEKPVVVPSDGVIQLTAGNWALRITGTPQAKANLGIWNVTELGSEVFSLLAPPEDKKNLMRFAKLLPDQGFETIELFELGKKTGPEKRTIISREVLREEAPKKD